MVKTKKKIREKILGNQGKIREFHGIKKVGTMYWIYSFPDYIFAYRSINGYGCEQIYLVASCKTNYDVRPGYESREIQLKPGRISLNSISKSSSGSSEYVPSDPIQGSVQNEQKLTRKRKFSLMFEIFSFNLFRLFFDPFRFCVRFRSV